MSNDKELARVLKLWAKVSMMVVDGKRDATSIADALQSILDQPQIKHVFDPSTFIGKEWSFVGMRNPRSAAFSIINDYSKVELSDDWYVGGLGIDGEARRRRILRGSSVPLNSDHFFDLWTNKEKIPQEWKNVERITFDGDVLLQSSHNRRFVIGLFWSGDGWDWDCFWLGNQWRTRALAAVFIG